VDVSALPDVERLKTIVDDLWPTMTIAPTTRIDLVAPGVFQVTRFIQEGE